MLRVSVTGRVLCCDYYEEYTIKQYLILIKDLNKEIIILIFIIKLEIMVKKEQRAGLTETAIDTTINIHKLAHRTQFKRKAPKAVN